MDETTDGETQSSYSPISSPSALEREMRDRLRGRQLVVEAGLSEELLKHLQSALGGLQDSYYNPDIARRYPALYLSYLTAHGIFRYQAGNFWGSELLELQHQSVVDDITNAIRTLNLESFDRMVEAETSTAAVSRLLAHGGIPVYSLGDFFEVLVEDVLRVDGTATDMMAFWKDRSSRFTDRDRPIKRFLDYGGAISLDFLDRCIDLISGTWQTGTIPSAEEVGLPLHVVKAFASFADQHPIQLTRRVARERLPRPVVRIDPWGGDGPEVDLAPVPERYRSARWRVVGGANISCSGIEWQSLPLEPAKNWTVSLADSGPIREWTIPGLERDVPFLAFDPERMSIVNAERGITTGEVLLLVPKDATVEGHSSNGELIEPKVVEQLPSISGQWKSYEYRWISLERVGDLKVVRNGAAERVRVRNPASSVQFDANPVSGTTSDGLAVYSEPPALVLPASDGFPASAWSLKIDMNGESRSFSMDDLQETEIGRSLGAVLPDDRATRVDLVVRGPLGSDLRESFVLVPGLTVVRPERLVLPADPTPIVEITVPGCKTSEGIPAERIQLPVAANESAVSLTLMDVNDKPVTVQVALEKLLWAVTPEGRATQEFATSLVTIPFEDLNDGAALTLRVRCGQSRPQLRLELVDADQRSLQETELVSSSNLSGQWTFHLGAFTDTLRNSGSSSHLLRLWVGEVPCTVARVVAPVTASGLSIESLLVSDLTSVTVRFEDPRPSRDRVVRFWSLSRLWADPITEQLDEGVVEVHVLRETSELPPGPYLVEVAIDDGWTTQIRPTSCESESVVRMDLGSQQDLEAYIDSLDLDDPHNLMEQTLLTNTRSRRLSDDELIALAPDIVESLVALSELAGNRVRTPHGYLPVRALLCVNPAATAHGFNEFASRHPDRRHLLVGLALYLLARTKPDLDEVADPREMEGLWQTCPPLAARLDLVDDPTGERHDRLVRFLGCEFNEASDPVTPDDALTQLQLGMDVELLTLILAGSTLVPEGLLDGGTAQEVQAEWLIANASDGREVDNWGNESTLAKRWMRQHDHLIQGLREIPENGRKFVNRRLMDRVGIDGEFGWGSLPAVTLAAAFHVLISDNDWEKAVDALASAALFAPGLVNRDLVLAQVLLSMSAQNQVEVSLAGEPPQTAAVAPETGGDPCANDLNSSQGQVSDVQNS